VLDKYMGYLRSLPKCVGTIGLLSVDCRVREGINENMRDFLSKSLQPADLVLDAPRDNSFLLIGFTGGAAGRTASKTISTPPHQRSTPILIDSVPGKGTMVTARLRADFRPAVGADDVTSNPVTTVAT
jgi:hypothetical protein